jgi:dihydrofolate synthase/folylpolyglutamate synthase
MRTYEETLQYLFSKLPMFTRIGAAAFKKDLTNTLALCSVLNNPQLRFKTVHVAGTNGKGSTSHMIASVLQAAGYKVGLYTSPHLRDFRERIKINGMPIPESVVIDFVNTYSKTFESIEPSFFEWSVALCFDYFANQQVDIAIIETGLGGRLDSTNIITPILSVITNIGWDHMDMLGDTLPQIASEKAGIIKPGIPVVVGEFDQDTKPVFAEASLRNQSNIVWAQESYSVHVLERTLQSCTMNIYHNGTLMYESMLFDLAGIYQQKNGVTAIAALQELNQLGFSFSVEQLRNGLRSVKTNTGLMGRWQVLRQQPLVICDTGHNVNGIAYVMEQLKSQTYNALHMVVGMVRDKDIEKVLKLLPTNATYYFCAASIPRALPAAQLQQQANQLGLMGDSYLSVQAAYEAALKQAADSDLIFIGGSTFVVAEVV